MNYERIKEVVGEHLLNHSSDSDSDFDDLVLKIVEGAVDMIEDGHYGDVGDCVSAALDNGLIYTEDQWAIVKHYCDPRDVNFDEAVEQLHNDCYSIVSELAEEINSEEDEDMEDEDMDESHRPRGRMLREGRGPRKVTRRFLKSMVEDGEAVDITNYSEEQIDELEKKEHRLKEIGNGFGVYGMNCGWYRGENTGTDYVVLSRNGNLFYLG